MRRVLLPQPYKAKPLPPILIVVQYTANGAFFRCINEYTLMIRKRRPLSAIIIVFCIHNTTEGFKNLTYECEHTILQRSTLPWMGAKVPLYQRWNYIGTSTAPTTASAGRNRPFSHWTANVYVSWLLPKRMTQRSNCCMRSPSACFKMKQLRRTHGKMPSSPYATRQSRNSTKQHHCWKKMFLTRELENLRWIALLIGYNWWIVCASSIPRALQARQLQQQLSNLHLYPDLMMGNLWMITERNNYRKEHGPGMSWNDIQAAKYAGLLKTYTNVKSVQSAYYRANRQKRKTKRQKKKWAWGWIILPPVFITLLLKEHVWNTRCMIVV